MEVKILTTIVIIFTILFVYYWLIFSKQLNIQIEKRGQIKFSFLERIFGFFLWFVLSGFVCLGHILNLKDKLSKKYGKELKK